MNAGDTVDDGSPYWGCSAGSITLVETMVRSVVKAFMWHVIASLVTFLMSLCFSESIATALIRFYQQILRHVCW